MSESDPRVFQAESATRSGVSVENDNAGFTGTGYVDFTRAAGAQVLLLGMLIPPNYGPEYTGQFRELYPRLAKELNVPLVPFVLEGVGGEVRLNQPDGIHPTDEGHRVVAKTVLPHLRAVVKERLAQRPARQERES